jgi:ABC-type cobalt transport system substrate-binding protein
LKSHFKKEFYLKSILISFLIFFLAYPSAFAQSSDDSKMEDTLKANVVDFRDWLIKELSQFPKVESDRASVSRRYVSVQNKKPFTTSQYNQAAKSDWVKCLVLQGLSTLSQQLANTAGTAYASQSATQLQQYSVQLQQSDDPQFQQVGTLFNQESEALQTGNIQAADQTATQVAAVPQPYVPPGYQPSSSENSLVQTFNQVIGTVIASLAGILGTLAVAQILATLGIPSLASLLGTGQVLGTSVASGQSPTTALTNAGNSTIQTGGSVAIQQGIPAVQQQASVALQQLGNVNVKPLQSQSSANAGGAPLAQ